MNNRYNRRPFYNKNEAIDKKNRIITILIVFVIGLLFILNSQRKTINMLESENTETLKEYKKYVKTPKRVEKENKDDKIVVENKKDKPKSIGKTKPVDKPKEKEKEKLDTTSIIKNTTQVIVDTLR